LPPSGWRDPVISNPEFIPNCPPRKSNSMTEKSRGVRERLMDRWWDAAELLCTQLEAGLREPLDDELADVMVLVRLDRVLQCDCEAELCDCGLTAEQRGLTDQLKATERDIEALGGWIPR
jgi:hypothetical protein